MTDTARPRTSWPGGIASPRDGCSDAVELIFKETAMFTSRLTKAMASKVNRASHGPGVLAKERTRKVRQTGHPKNKCKVLKCAKGSYNVKVRKLVLKIRSQRQVQKRRNLHRLIRVTFLTPTMPLLMVTDWSQDASE